MIGKKQELIIPDNVKQLKTATFKPKAEGNKLSIWHYGCKLEIQMCFRGKSEPLKIFPQQDECCKYYVSRSTGKNNKLKPTVPFWSILIFMISNCSILLVFCYILLTLKKRRKVLSGVDLYSGSHMSVACRPRFHYNYICNSGGISLPALHI